MTDTAPTLMKPEEPEEDAAWVRIETPYGAGELVGFLDDVERLFRINSQLVFEGWQDMGGGEYRFEARNLSNGKTLKTRLKAERTEDGLAVVYSDGLKTSTTFRIEDKPDGTADLVVTDDYRGAPVAERQSRIDEVDRSLVQWGRDFHRYLRQWKRWSRVPGWAFYMRRVWQPMRPSARRICFLLFAITLAEFVMFLLVFLVFWLEMDKYF